MKGEPIIENLETQHDQDRDPQNNNEFLKVHCCCIRWLTIITAGCRDCMISNDPYDWVIAAAHRSDHIEISPHMHVCILSDHCDRGIVALDFSI